MSEDYECPCCGYTDGREMTYQDLGLRASSELTIGQMFQRDHSDFYPLSLEEIQSNLLDRSWWEKIDARGAI